MMTNLEIENSLAAELEAAAKARGISTRDFIRHAILQAIQNPGAFHLPNPFVQQVHDFGTHIESPWTVLVDLETEEYAQQYSRK
jgi:hypothetical protein